MNNIQYLVTDGDEFYKYNNMDYAKNKVREMLNECCNISDIEVYEIRKLDVSMNVVINNPID